MSVALGTSVDPSGIFVGDDVVERVFLGEAFVFGLPTPSFSLTPFINNPDFVYSSVTEQSILDENGNFVTIPSDVLPLSGDNEVYYDVQPSRTNYATNAGSVLGITKTQEAENTLKLVEQATTGTHYDSQTVSALLTNTDYILSFEVKASANRQKITMQAQDASGAWFSVLIDFVALTTSSSFQHTEKFTVLSDGYVRCEILWNSGPGTTNSTLRTYLNLHNGTTTSYTGSTSQYYLLRHLSHEAGQVKSNPILLSSSVNSRLEGSLTLQTPENWNPQEGLVAFDMESDTWGVVPNPMKTTAYVTDRDHTYTLLRGSNRADYKQISTNDGTSWLETTFPSLPDSGRIKLFLWYGFELSTDNTKKGLIQGFIHNGITYLGAEKEFDGEFPNPNGELKLMLNLLNPIKVYDMKIWDSAPELTTVEKLLEAM